ncbi:MFS general substrate transporter [Hortaea werneckii]|nr:MFS general substrate transporter [Hortaea werneckii]
MSVQVGNEDESQSRSFELAFMEHRVSGEISPSNQHNESGKHEGSKRSSFFTRTNREEDQDDTGEPYLDRTLQPTMTNSPPFSIFTIQQKRFIVFMVAMAGFFSPLSANIYFPALNTLARDFNVSSGVINLTLTSYMIFQGLAPTVFGDLADMAGRRPAYLIGFAIYIGACIGIACCNSYAGLLVLRCLQASGSSGTIALASGVVADIATSAERGMWMGWATSGPMVAPALAPVLGGIFSEFLGWRWIFWFLVILACVFVIPFALIFPETGRNVVGNGSVQPQGWNMSLINYVQYRKAQKDTNALSRTVSRESQRTAQLALAKHRRLRIPNPLNALHLLLEKDVSLLLFYNSIVYCAFYDVMASAPDLLERIYGYDALQIGLCFLPFGVGCLLAPSLAGKLMDWNFRRTAKIIGYEIVKGKANDLRNFPLERVRISVALPMVFVGDAALLCYGWVMHVETNLAAPLVLMFIIGLALTGAFNAMNVMLVDLYPLSPATATSANNLVRCLMGAGATVAVIYMIEAMGRGWCFTFVAGVVAALSPILWVLEVWGPEWREQRRVRAEQAKAKEDDDEQDAHQNTSARFDVTAIEDDREKS